MDSLNIHNQMTQKIEIQKHWHSKNTPTELPVSSWENSLTIFPYNDNTVMSLALVTLVKIKSDNFFIALNFVWK